MIQSTVLDVEKLCNMPALRKVSLMGNPLNDELQQKLATTAKFELLLPVADENFSDVDWQWREFVNPFLYFVFIFLANMQ